MSADTVTTCIESFVATVQPQDVFYVAYSGGVDSHVLLHALATRLKNVKAIHINHQLSPNADKWAAHCQQVCQTLNVACIIKNIHVQAQVGESPEDVARKARYHMLFSIINEIAPTTNQYLLTAHHQEDQAETVLLQLMRGAGPKGLSGMPARREQHLRPLLQCDKAAILMYAKQHQLTWINDESNDDVNFDRNFIRHHILPQLKKCREGVVNNIVRSAKLCAETQMLLTELAKIDLATVKIKDSQIEVTQLKTLNILRMKNVLRYWLSLHHVRLPSEKKMQHIIQDVVLSRYDARPKVAWDGVELCRIKNTISIHQK